MAKAHTLHPVNPSSRLSSTFSAALGTLLAIGLVSAPMPSYAQSSEPLPDLESAEDEPAAAESTEGDSTEASNARFQCQVYEGEFTVMYSPESQPDKAYPWATPTSMGGGWDAEKRCNTISERLESYRPEGLIELQVGLENGYDVVCATTEQVPGVCKLVFTVPLGQNPVVTRDRVFENLTLADAGSNTNIVSTFTSNDASNILGQIGEVLNLPTSASPSTDTSINLKPFLDTADGGTGSALSAGTPSRTLSPDNFR
jgi:hypothetical protein